MPIALVPKPTAAEEARRDMGDILREALAEVEAGEIESLILICRRPDGHWCDRRSAVFNFCDAIGKLEILKQSWIRTYLDGQD